MEPMERTAVSALWGTLSLTMPSTEPPLVALVSVHQFRSVIPSTLLAFHTLLSLFRIVSILSGPQYYTVPEGAYITCEVIIRSYGFLPEEFSALNPVSAVK